MKPTKTRPDIPSCTPQLLALAAVIREDVDPRDLEGALIACKTAGWTWRRILSEAVLMLCRGEEPRDLREATRDPLKQRLT